MNGDNELRNYSSCLTSVPITADPIVSGGNTLYVIICNITSGKITVSVQQKAAYSAKFSI